MKPSKLGKGLSALFEETGLSNAAGDRAPTETGASASKSEQGEGGVRLIRLDEIVPGHGQPRTHFDVEKLQELADSIRENGLLQPVIVQLRKEGGYALIAGERRWRACKMLGRESIEAVVREASAQSAAELALIENIQRENLGPLEEAVAYRKLMDEYGYTQETLAGKVGKSRPHVANSLRLLQLPEGVLTLLREGSITAGHARALLGHQEAEHLAREAASKGLSVRDVERLARKPKPESRPRGSAKPLVKNDEGAKPRKETEEEAPAETPVSANSSEADLELLERSMHRLLGLNVAIRYGTNGEGKVEIHFKSLEELDTVLLACESYADRRKSRSENDALHTEFSEELV